MSTAALIGKATYTGVNGSNGNVAVGVAVYTGNVNGGSISPTVSTANLTSPGSSSVTGIAVYTGTNGSNGNVATRIPTTGNIGVQGLVASPLFGPTYNPGS